MQRQDENYGLMMTQSGDLGISNSRCRFRRVIMVAEGFVPVVGLAMMCIGAVGFVVCIAGIINWYRQHPRKTGEGSASGPQGQGV